MARFNLVQLGSIYFTGDGTETGKPCKVEVEGLDGLVLAYTGNTTKAADGTPYNFTAEFLGEGVDIRMLPFVLNSDVYDALKELITDAIANETLITAVVEGDTGIFNFDCMPLFSPDIRPIQFSGKFINGRIYGVAINLTVVALNP